MTFQNVDIRRFKAFKKVSCKFIHRDTLKPVRSAKNGSEGHI